MIILTVNALENLPKTIASRSRILRFGLVDPEAIYEHLIAKYGANRPAAKNISRLALGRPALAVKFFEDEQYIEKHYEIVKLFLECAPAPYHERLNAVSGYLGEKADEAKKNVNKILDIWIALSRDILLQYYGHVDLLQNQQVRLELARMSRNVTIGRIVGWAETLSTAKKYLAGNVNPKNVLEYAAINL